MNTTPPGAFPGPSSEEAALISRLSELRRAGWEIWERFSAGDSRRPFHPFEPADYDLVCESLWPYRGTGLRFLEWGSATGVVTVIADMLGFEAYGIELDSGLSEIAIELAKDFDSGAQFVRGSFLPDGYRWESSDGDRRTGTLGTGRSGYLQLGRPLEDFDVVFGYPWDGEEPMMMDLIKSHGQVDAILLLNSTSAGVQAYRNGINITADPPWLKGPASRGSTYRAVKDL